MMYYISYSVPIVILLLSLLVSYLYVMSQNKPEFQMARNGLLFLSNICKTSKCLSAASRVKKVLYIKLNEKISTNIISREIVNIYNKASSQCADVDVRIILQYDKKKTIKTNYPIDVVMYDHELSSEIEGLKKSIITIDNNCKVHSLDCAQPTINYNSEGDVKTYNYVALGGTFDRLHNGHKILLSQAVLRSKQHLTVGVTDINMIQSKKLWELIQPVEERIKAVLNFLTDINSDLEYNVVPIQDLYGPTKDDPRFQMIVVSEETKRGAMKINEKRKENGLLELETYTIELAADPNPQRSDEEEPKISSSNTRMRLLGTQLKPLEENPNIPDWPYVIGLAGGIASGKSSIAEKLRAKGAAIINCDIIAHDLYKPGLPLNQTLAENFGQQIITETGEVDRAMLGQIVFSQKDQLEKLNKLVWPAVIEEAQRRIRELGVLGHKVVVMEAAVMVRARWYQQCHQLWAVIVPPEEAIRRIQERNGLSEEQARQRVESQPSNSEQVKLADVVFSPYWSYEYTQAQVDRAWDLLQTYLHARR